MKSTELMINDWVEYGQYITTVRHLSDKIVLAGCVGRLDEVRPVPLTPEILEKNGFENYKTIGSLSYYKNKDNNLKFEFYGKTLEDYAGNRIIELGYVHELQHALRLCGIKDDIVL